MPVVPFEMKRLCGCRLPGAAGNSRLLLRTGHLRTKPRLFRANVYLFVILCREHLFGCLQESFQVGGLAVQGQH